jgi:ribosome-binding protein aMBF1 (putative translation factor)
MNKKSPDTKSQNTPETKYSKLIERSTTEAKLYPKKAFVECPSGAVTDTVFTAGVIGMDFWVFNETSLNGGKDFSAGRVELQIRDQFNLSDLAEITYQAKEVIAQQFGEQTLKLHYALTAIAFRKTEAWKQEITVSVSKLLADFGETQKRNLYIPKNERDNDSKPTCYLSKEEKLRQLIHHVYLLKRLEVWVKEWRVRNKGIFTVEKSNLWNILAITEVVQKNINGEDELIDIEITYRPGLWFEKFAGTEYLREFGYLTSEALKLDPYREKMALRLAYFALFALQQHKNGRYQIETLLRRIGYGNDIDAASSNGSIRYNLKRSFDRALKTLSKFQHPYGFNYDSDVPEWLNGNSKTRKPKNWFETWLECQGTLYQPNIVPKRQLKTEKQKSKPIEIEEPKINNNRQTVQATKISSDPKIFGQQIKEARESIEVSLRTMAKDIYISASRLSQIENGKYAHQLQPDLKAKILTYLGIEISLQSSTEN